jgi:hypothetical protein
MLGKIGLRGGRSEEHLLQHLMAARAFLLRVWLVRLLLRLPDESHSRGIKGDEDLRLLDREGYLGAFKGVP